MNWLLQHMNILVVVLIFGMSALGSIIRWAQRQAAEQKLKRAAEQREIDALRRGEAPRPGVLQSIPPVPTAERDQTEQRRRDQLAELRRRAAARQREQTAPTQLRTPPSAPSTPSPAGGSALEMLLGLPPGTLTGNAPGNAPGNAGGTSTPGGTALPPARVPGPRPARTPRPSPASGSTGRPATSPRSALPAPPAFPGATPQQPPRRKPKPVAPRPPQPDPALDAPASLPYARESSASAFGPRAAPRSRLSALLKAQPSDLHRLVVMSELLRPPPSLRSGNEPQ